MSDHKSSNNRRDQTAATVHKEIDIIATYFINRYWNSIYTAAYKAHREGKFRDLLDAFRSISVEYLNIFTDKSKGEIHELYAYYKKYVPNCRNYNRFVDDLAEFMLPSEYRNRADDIIWVIIFRSLSKFTQWGVEHSDLFLDDLKRNSKETMISVKMQLYEFIQAEINSFHSRSIAKKTGAEIGVKEAHSAKSIEIMGNRLRMMMKNNTELVEQLNKANNRILQLEQELNDVKKKILHPPLPVQVPAVSQQPIAMQPTAMEQSTVARQTQQQQQQQQQQPATKPPIIANILGRTMELNMPESYSDSEEDMVKSDQEDVQMVAEPIHFANPVDTPVIAVARPSGNQPSNRRIIVK